MESRALCLTHWSEQWLLPRALHQLPGKSLGGDLALLLLSGDCASNVQPTSPTPISPRHVLICGAFLLLPAKGHLRMAREGERRRFSSTAELGATVQKTICPRERVGRGRVPNQANKKPLWFLSIQPYGSEPAMIQFHSSSWDACQGCQHQGAQPAP